MAIQQFSLSPEPLKPIARPVDTYIPAPRPDYPAVSQTLGNLANALASINPALNAYGEKRMAEISAADKAAGLQAGFKDQAKTWKEAIEKGLVDETASPFWRKGYSEAKGRLAGHHYRQHMMNLYDAWEGKNQVTFITDPATGEKIIDHAPFMDFLSAGRLAYLDSSDDPDWLNGFRPSMEMAESHLLDHHTAYVQDHLKKERLDTLYQEVSHMVKNGFREGKSPNDILASLAPLESEAQFTGMDKRLLKQATNEAVLLTAQELKGSLGLTLLNAIKPESAESASKLAHARSHLEAHLLNEENRAYTRRQHDRAEARERAFAFIAEKFEQEGMNWQPDEKLALQMIHDGVYDFRATVETARKAFTESDLHHDAESKNQFYSNLYAGRLTADQIIWEGSSTNPHRLLNPQEVKEALNIHRNETPITQLPLIQDVKRTLANQLAPGMLDRYLNELPGADPEKLGLAYQGLEELDRRLIELKKQNPAITADPQALLKEAQTLRQAIVDDYSKRKQDHATPSKEAATHKNTDRSEKEDSTKLSSLPPQARVKLPFKDKAEYRQAIKDFNAGKGKIRDFLKAHNLTLTQEQFEAFLEYQNQ